MKKLLILILFSAASYFTLFGQEYDALDRVRNDWRKASGMEGPHRMDEFASLTPAPKGYKPFYITHYGRHGSRYSWTDKTYKVLHTVFTNAHTEGVLTPLGEEFYRKYEDFYELPLMNTGYLTQLGFEQHKKIGEFMYDSFPEVFKDGRRVEVLSSTAQRCIVSMSSFCLSLKGRNPKLDINQTSDVFHMSIITPTNAPGGPKFYKMPSIDSIKLEKVQDFNARKINASEIYARFFTDTSFISRQEDKGQFLSCLHSFLSGYRNYSEEPIFDGTLSQEQIVGLWETGNYGSFYGDIFSRYFQIPLLEDFISKAQDAFDDPARAADLRFGHDYILEAFTCLLNLNGCGTIPETADEAKYWFQNYNIPMAATVFFAFYRNRADDILFKVIWNEKEATLPQLNPVSGCYYKWSDFISWTESLLAAHPRIERPTLPKK